MKITQKAKRAVRLGEHEEDANEGEEEANEAETQMEKPKRRRRTRTKSKSPVKTSAGPRTILPAAEKPPSPDRVAAAQALYSLSGLGQASDMGPTPNGPMITPPLPSADSPRRTSPEPLSSGKYNSYFGQSKYRDTVSLRSEDSLAATDNYTAADSYQQQQTQQSTVYPTPNYHTAGYPAGIQGSSIQGPDYPQVVPFQNLMQQTVVAQQPVIPQPPVMQQQYAPLAVMGYSSNVVAGPSTQHYTTNSHPYHSSNRMFES